MVVKALTDTIHSLHVFVHVPTLARTIPHSGKRCILPFARLNTSLKSLSITTCLNLRKTYLF